MAWLLWSPRRSTGGNHEVKQTAPNGIATFNTPHRMETNAETMPPQRHRSACCPADRGKPIISFGRSLNTSVQPAGCKATPHPQLLPLPTTTCNTHKMRPATVAKWLEENANAPPPPATPAGLPDDSVSTVYPESSVSNPYASRYTGTRHRSIPFARGTQPSYIERRPLSAQAHHRDHHQPIYVAPPSRPRHNSFSPESRYIPSQPQPFAYTYHGPPSPLHTGKHSRDASHLIRSPQYRVVSSSPNREDISRSQEFRQHPHETYYPTPTITLETRSSVKKQSLLRRLLGIGSGPKSSRPSRSSSNSQSRQSRQSRQSHSRSLSRGHDDRTDRHSRGRTHSDGVIYVRY